MRKCHVDEAGIRGGANIPKRNKHMGAFLKLLNIIEHFVRIEAEAAHCVGGFRIKLGKIAVGRELQLVLRDGLVGTKTAGRSNEADHVSRVGKVLASIKESNLCRSKLDGIRSCLASAKHELMSLGMVEASEERLFGPFPFL